ncbi:steroid 17-alpha-hydroxylase/17,20 lyase-like [Oppia nitens]|uniref:steroid 17-alpha-hydroxylase/17,20 lyase-like n=1 Tax=Oppia nitens TaxID=1686743 RepID=UPI0023DA9CB8|nr:steroid 17-alpha-hydroxylase/17,20 lyase-like [Oppia nitens]
MSVLSQLYSLIISDIWTTIIRLLIGYVVYYLAKFYYKHYSLPPGPFPLPLIGNYLTFRTKHHWDYAMRQMAKKYGPIFTVYLGNSPQIVITDPVIARDVFNRSEFAGRTQTYFVKLMGDGVIMADYGPNWETRRNVAQAAVRKYSNNERLVNVVVDCVDKTVETMLKTIGPNKPIEQSNYIYLTFLNIMANSAFNENYNFDDPEFKKFKYVLNDINYEWGTRFLLYEYSKLIQWIDYKCFNQITKVYEEIREIIVKKIRNHYKDYDPSIERDFCDTLIEAKNTALRDVGQGDSKQSVANYLTDDKLGMIVLDIFQARIDTSYNTFQWLLLFLSSDLVVQKKLRKEISDKIGDRLPTLDDRQQCHYVMAFISETLRFRNVVPVAVPRKAMVDSKIGNYMIPKNMSIAVFQGFILRNDSNKYWTNPNDFIPERFLDSDNHYMITRLQQTAYIPFGIGRRVCLGEKLATADLFLVLTRFLQSTQNYDIVLDSHPGFDADPYNVDLVSPCSYSIIFKSKS